MSCFKIVHLTSGCRFDKDHFLTLLPCSRPLALTLSTRPFSNASPLIQGVFSELCSSYTFATPQCEFAPLHRLYLYGGSFIPRRRFFLNQARRNNPSPRIPPMPWSPPASHRVVQEGRHPTRTVSATCHRLKGVAHDFAHVILAKAAYLLPQKTRHLPLFLFYTIFRPPPPPPFILHGTNPRHGSDANPPFPHQNGHTRLHTAACRMLRHVPDRRCLIAQPYRPFLQPSARPTQATQRMTTRDNTTFTFWRLQAPERTVLGRADYALLNTISDFLAYCSH